MHKPDVLFVLTIDTEEEWLWDEEFPQDDCSIQNVGRLPDFHKACVELGIRPTYFVDYAVANDIDFSVIKPKQKIFVIKSYEENFTKN